VAILDGDVSNPIKRLLSNKPRWLH
jgi:hypothetical protein